MFPNNIRSLRLRAGLTQERLGRLLDPPKVVSTVSKIENGERRLSNLQIANFADVLGCRPEDIPVVSHRDRPNEVQRWQKAQQEVIQQSVESGAAAIGFVLAELRKKSGKTMQQVAQAIGVTISVYYRIEMASRMIRENEIEAIARFYGLSEGKLIKMFERKTQENLEQLKKGVPPEQLVPRYPRALLKQDSKWRQLGALERYAMRRSLRIVRAEPKSNVLPVYGRTRLSDRDGGRVFEINRDAVFYQMRIDELFEPREDCFIVHNYSNRLGFFLRAGALAYVDPAAPVNVGDVVFMVRRDGTADAALIIGDGIGSLKLKMFGPEEEIEMDDANIANVYRVEGIMFPR